MGQTHYLAGVDLSIIGFKGHHQRLMPDTAPLAVDSLLQRPDGLDLATTRWNEGNGPATILSHGGGQTRHSWRGTASKLAKRGFDVTAYDHRGHGDSSWSPEAHYEMTDFVQDAIALAEHIRDPVAWVGASLGGMTGMLAGESRPELLTSLVLVDITARPAMAGVERILGFMASKATEGFGSLEEAADAIAEYQPHRSRPNDLSGLQKNLRRGADGRWRWHWDPLYISGRRSMVNSNHDDRHSHLETAARQLAVPTLLIRGKLSDLVTDAEVAEFREMVPHASYVDVADAAHMIAGDKNDVFTDAVVTFLEAQCPDASPEA